MQKIIPHLWFDKVAVEAAEFYVEAFGGDSEIKSKSQITDTSSGTVDMLSLKIRGYDFEFLGAGPEFKINPSVSFTVLCKTADEVDELWAKLIEGGRALMELDSYFFSKRYGWVMDRFGVSWQLLLFEQDVEPTVIPTLMFTDEYCGKCEEAMNYYISVFGNSKLGDILRYGEHDVADTEGTIQHADFFLEGQMFSAMDSAYDHKFKFNEAISFIVYCEDQNEIDHFWEKLSAVKEAEQCGWLKDKFGVSWQIVPKAMIKMMSDGDDEARARVTQAFLKMKKFDIAELEKAFEG